MRLDLARFANFDLERIPADEGIYRSTAAPATCRATSASSCWPTRAIALPSPGASSRTISRPSSASSTARLADFVRSCRRTIHSRRLQWNRIVDLRGAGDLSRARGRARGGAPARSRDPTPRPREGDRARESTRSRAPMPARAHRARDRRSRDQTEIEVREPHHDSLHPAQDYERAVVNASRLRLDLSL